MVPCFFTFREWPRARCQYLEFKDGVGRAVIDHRSSAARFVGSMTNRILSLTDTVVTELCHALTFEHLNMTNRTRLLLWHKLRLLRPLLRCYTTVDDARNRSSRTKYLNLTSFSVHHHYPIVFRNSAPQTTFLSSSWNVQSLSPTSYPT